jgi:diguanylate cyclase (GGDEF)-like protein
MFIAQQSLNQEKLESSTVVPNIKPANHALYSQYPQQVMMENLWALQSTLDIEKLLSIYASEINQHINIDGIAFKNDQTQKHWGQTEQYQCSFKLVIDGNFLGTLKYSRKIAFTDSESKDLESRLCVLVSPLRNAIDYFNAMQLAYTDALTGIKNRTAMNESLDREVSLAQRQLGSLTMMILDIDFFKNINDTYGHQAGDKALKMVANCIQNTVRNSDIVFRYGGEEFVILLSNSSSNGGKLLAERIRSSIETIQCQHQNETFSMTISIGTTEFKPHDTKDTLAQRADKALYQAKESGRNQVIHL